MGHDDIDHYPSTKAIRNVVKVAKSFLDRGVEEVYVEVCRWTDLPTAVRVQYAYIRDDSVDKAVQEAARTNRVTLRESAPPPSW